MFTRIGCSTGYVPACKRSNVTGTDTVERASEHRAPQALAEDGELPPSAVSLTGWRPAESCWLTLPAFRANHGGVMSVCEMLDAERSVVVVIDLQGKLIEMAYRSRLVVEATARLMRLAEVFEVPVVLTEQYPKGLGSTKPEVREVFDGLTVPTRYVDKTSFGCCGDADFMPALDEVRPVLEPARRQVVVAGIEAHVCVMQTVLELLRRGEQVHVCWECVSGRGEEYRRHALDRMQQAGAQITNHESVCFEWARDKNHPGFKAMNQILRDGQLT